VVEKPWLTATVPQDLLERPPRGPSTGGYRGEAPEEQGTYISGIIVKPKVYDRDYGFGAPLAGPSEGFSALVSTLHFSSVATRP
jgi:hypothetical protein